MDTLETKLRLVASEVKEQGVCYLRLMRDAHGKVQDFAVINPRQVAKYLTEDGMLPLPPSPAYTQLFHGLPAADYTTEQIVEISAPIPDGRIYSLAREELALALATM